MNSSKWRILIVDSEPEWLRFSRSALERAGYVVETVEDSKDASRFAEGESFDLILMNLKQAEEQDIGGNFAEHRYKGGRIVIMVPTQISLPKMRISFKSLGASDCVDKPFNKDELIRVVEEELGEYYNGDG